MVTNRRKSNSQRFFIWQAAFILLPVIVLALLGLSFLRQDRLLARREAEQRAQEIADELLPKCSAALLATNDPALPLPHALLVSADARLVSPAPIPDAKPVFLDLSRLTAEQLILWHQMQGFGENKRGADEELEAARKIVAANLSHSLTPIALYRLGALEQQQGNTFEAARNFARLIQQFPQAIGETGLPLAPLARLKILQMSAFATNWPSQAAEVTATYLCSNVVSNPSQLSEPILDAMAQIVTPPQEKDVVEKWRVRWEIDQATRQLYGALRDYLAQSNIGAPFWFHMEEPLRTANPYFPMPRRWLAFRPELTQVTNPKHKTPAAAGPILTPFASTTEPQILETTRALNAESPRTGAYGPEQTNFWLFLYNEFELNKRVMTYVRAGNVPEYLGVAIEAVDKNLPSPFLPDTHLWREVGYIASKGGGVKKEVLAETATDILASAVLSSHGTDVLRVHVYLTSPTDLFKRQRTRTFWLGSVIGTSFVAALAGLVAAWRSFSRQQQLAEMKTNFVSSVSHELRAPIASVRLLAESLERGSVSTPDKQNQYYQFIGQECRRLSSLIENVLDFSRIEQGRKQYEFEPTDVVALVRQTVTLMDPYAAEREVSLVFENSSAPGAFDPMGIMVDGQAIQQALINLVDNALKHSAKGQAVKVGLAVASRAAEPNGGEERSVVQIYVEDQGPGIPEAEHQKIFERFYRLGSELRRETQGIGIGLSIVKHVVEAHGGKVIVRSSPGAGCRLTIELPMKTEIVA